MQNEPKKSIKKPIIITAIIIAVMLIAAGVAVMLIPRHEDAQDPGEDDEQTMTVEMYKKKFTEEMKMYEDLCGKELDWDSLESKVKKINSSATLTKIDDYVGQINIGSSKKNEYIRFDIVREEVDSPDTAINFVYYYYLDDEHVSFVMKTGESKYQSYNGAVTNEFESLDEALADNMLVHTDK